MAINIDAAIKMRGKRGRMKDKLIMIVGRIPVASLATAVAFFLSAPAGLVSNRTISLCGEACRNNQ